MSRQLDPAVIEQNHDEAIAAIQGLPTREERDAAIVEYAAATGLPARLLLAEAERRSPAPRDEAVSPSPPSWRRFPTEVLGGQLSHYVRTVAAAVGVDESFVALPALCTIAGTVGNRARVRLKTSWTEPAVLWGAVVARSGRLKSPALSEVTRPVRRREAEVVERYRESLADHEREVGAWSEQDRGKRGAKPEAPAPPARSLVSDVTVEALVARLAESPAGVLLVRDELAGWVRSFDAYRSGRGGDAQAWLEMHRAGTVFVDRKTDGPLSVPRAAVSIVGSVQPGVLRDALRGEHLENGLAARVLLVMPPSRPKAWSDRGIPDAVRESWVRLLDRLRTPFEMGSVPVDLPLTSAAHDVFVTFYNRHAVREADADSEALAAAFAKLEGAAARLALVLQLARDPESRAVDAEAMRSGVALAEWFASETERVYGTFVETPEDRDRRELVEWIGSRGGTTTARDLQRGPRRYRASGAAERALYELAAAGYGGWSELPTGTDGGRPTTVFKLTTACTEPVLNKMPGGDGDTTGSVASGDITPQRGLSPGQTLATKPSGLGEVSSPSPPQDPEGELWQRQRLHASDVSGSSSRPYPSVDSGTDTLAPARCPGRPPRSSRRSEGTSRRL